MRMSPAKYLLIALSMVALSGCKSGETTTYSPSATLSKLNPFSSSRDKSDYPVRPSALATATPASARDAGFATATSPTTTPGTAADSQYSYPTASNASLASSRSPSSSVTTPQTGSYGSKAAQAAAGLSSTPSAGSRYPWDTSAGSPAAASYGSTDGSYRGASPSGAYGGAAQAAPRYSVPSDRYGYNASSGASPGSPPSRATTPADPYASVRDHNAQYTVGSQGLGVSSGAAPKASYTPPASSGYADFSNSSDRYGATSPATEPSPAGTSDPGSRYGIGAGSSESDRYARADSASAGAYNSYQNGQLANSQGDTSWNPGAPTDNAPGGSDYQPGNTGYNPPGVSAYGSPAAQYAPPSTTNNSTAPFLPGSTKLYEPRQSSPLGAPKASPSTSQPTTDSRVVPAGHTGHPAPTQSYLR